MTGSPTRRPGIDGIRHPAHIHSPSRPLSTVTSSNQSSKEDVVKSSMNAKQPGIIMQLVAPVEKQLIKLALLRIVFDVRFWLMLALPFVMTWYYRALGSSLGDVISQLRNFNPDRGYIWFVISAVSIYVVGAIALLLTVVLHQVMLAREIYRKKGLTVRAHSLVRLTAANSLRLTAGWLIHCATCTLIFIATTAVTVRLLGLVVIGKYYLAATCVSLGLAFLILALAAWSVQRALLATTSTRLGSSWRLAWVTVGKSPLFGLGYGVAGIVGCLVVAVGAVSFAYGGAWILLGTNSLLARLLVWVGWLLFITVCWLVFVILQARYVALGTLGLLAKHSSDVHNLAAISLPVDGYLQKSWKSLVLCLGIVVLLCVALVAAVGWRAQIVATTVRLQQSIPARIDGVVPSKVKL